MPSRFALDTSVAALGKGRYGAEIRPAWRAERPNGGCLEEDGEIWDRAGRLLAQSRQLAVIS